MARIQLDSEGLLWVLLPVMVITLISAVTRITLNQLSTLKGAGVGDMPQMIQSFAQLYVSGVSSASRVSRSAARIISREGMKVRKNFYVGANNDGKLSYPPPAEESPSMPQVDPTTMLGGMKYRFVALMMDAGLAYLISYLFAECVVARVPFSLPETFKPILQRGIAVPHLDPEFISPLSWYFVVLFSSGSFTHLFNYSTGILQSNGLSLMETMNPMAGPNGMVSPFQGFGNQDYAKTFQQESDHWRLVGQEDLLDGIEKLAAQAMS